MLLFIKHLDSGATQNSGLPRFFNQASIHWLRIDVLFRPHAFMSHRGGRRVPIRELAVGRPSTVTPGRGRQVQCNSILSRPGGLITVRT